MTQFSQALADDVTRAEPEEVKIALVAITLDGAGEPDSAGAATELVLRLSSDDVPTRSHALGSDPDGQPHIYQPFGFQFTPPAQDAERRVPGRLSIDNIDRRITEAIAALDTAPGVRAVAVLSGSVDDISLDFGSFRLVGVNWTNARIDGTLALPDDQDEPVCSLRFTPRLAPALYGTG